MSPAPDRSSITAPRLARHIMEGEWGGGGNGFIEVRRNCNGCDRNRPGCRALVARLCSSFNRRQLRKAGVGRKRQADLSRTRKRHADSDRYFQTGRAANNVFDTADEFGVGPPTNLAILPAGDMALVANSLEPLVQGWGHRLEPDNKVFLIDLKANPPAVIGTITVGKQPSGMAINPNFLRDQLSRHSTLRLMCYSGRGGEIRSADGTWRVISRDDAKRRFREGQADVLLCTDAAAEGAKFPVLRGSREL